MVIPLAASSHKNAEKDVNIDAQIHNTENHACFFVTNVVQNVCVCLLVLMATNNPVLATTIGRPRGEVPNALNRTLSVSRIRQGSSGRFQMLLIFICTLICPTTYSLRPVKIVLPVRSKNHG